jgi:hypothetical protein
MHPGRARRVLRKDGALPVRYLASFQVASSGGLKGRRRNNSDELSVAAPVPEAECAMLTLNPARDTGESY